MDMVRTVAGAVLVCLAGPALAQDADAGRERFTTYCATCHGVEARGDGPMADILVIAPADLTQLQRRNGGTFPLFRVVRQIDGRDPLLAHGGAMPLYGMMFPLADTTLKTETGQPILTSRPIADLAAWLEKIQE